MKPTTRPDAAPATPGCADPCACDAETRGRLLLGSATSSRLHRSAWVLTVLTIAWNGLEAAIAIASGQLAGSIALVGFGLDSVVEVSSALVIAWRLARQYADHAANERAERRAVRLIALSFFGIAAYVAGDSVAKLLGIGEHPEHSTVGLVLVGLSLVVMPTIAWAKRRVARGLNSVALKADAAETQLCTYLSAVVLVGLASNTLLGWWWMDPIAGLLVAGLALKEGRGAWMSGQLCVC
jgi:divalent metal cation (Fe/Co/Zn/Cd) transporter